MSAAPFDTHATVKRLTGVGMDAALAEAVIEAIRKTSTELATREDVRQLRHEVRLEIDKFQVSAMMNQLTWRMAGLLAVAIVLVMV